MTVRAVASGKGRVRTGRVGAQGPGGGGVSPAFQTDFSSLPSWVSHSRGSNAMVFDSTGKLTCAPNNFFVQSNTFSDASWSKSGTASVTGGFADPVGGSSAMRLDLPAVNDFISQFVNPFPIPKGIHSVWVRSDIAGTVHLNDGSGGGWNVSVSVGTTWTLVDTGPQTQASSAVRIIRLSGDLASLYIYNQVLAAVTYETLTRSVDQVITTSLPYYGPRFDYAFNGSAWVATGLMIEPQRTNLITQSVDLSNAAWPRINLASVTAVTGIDGTSSAFKLVPDATNGVHRIASNTFGSTSSPFEVQAIVTASGYNQVALRESAVTGTAAVFSLAGGGSVSGTFNFGSISVSNAAIASLGSGRFLISCLFTPSGAVTPNIGIYVLDGGWASGDPNSYAFAGNGTSGIVVECPQAEIGGFRTSYIPTTTAAVPRSADVPRLVGGAFTALTTLPYSIVMKISDAQVGFYNAMLGMGGVGGTDQAGLLENNGASTSQVASQDSSTANHNLIATLGSGATTGPLQLALGASSGGRSLAANGGTVVTDANVPTLSGTEIFLGQNSGTSSFTTMHCTGIAIYASRLPDADLQAKSVVGAAF